MPSEREMKEAYQAAADWVSKTFKNGEERYPHWPMIEAALEAAEKVRDEEKFSVRELAKKHGFDERTKEEKRRTFELTS